MPANKHVTIRMYNVGFGDAFLVLVPDGQKQRRILFDCGSIDAADGLEMKDIVKRIVADVTDPDGVARIDVVVGTHRHKDHVSGFSNPAWDDVEVKEVWMPWTEHPTDPEARRIRNIQSRLALGLTAALAAKGPGLTAAEQEELKRYRDIVDNALPLSNDTAMKTLHSGFSGTPEKRFLPEKLANSDSRTFETAALPGVRIHVMGPSRDREVIRDMDPPTGKSFLRMHGTGNPQDESVPAPFSPEFRQDSYTGSGTIVGDDLELIQRAGSLSDLAVAVALDKAVNGTSLMLLLEVAGTYFLFPGDAQWGTWNAALTDPVWSNMLKSLSFYKIGHHGSHNATPKEFVEHTIPDGICAMASTLTRSIWPDIPRIPLLDALALKDAKVARSDQPDDIAAPFLMDNGVVEVQIDL
jgi:beta-lactamase superfamily II metal-dependent hydrolase